MLLEALLLTMLSVFSECVFNKCTFGEQKEEVKVSCEHTTEHDIKNECRK